MSPLGGYDLRVLVTLLQYALCIIDLYCIICIRVILLANAAFISHLCVQWSVANAPSYQDYRFAERISTWEDGIGKVENFLTLT